MTRTRPETVIADDVVTVEPGQMAQTVLTVRNTGNEIAEYAVALVPDCVATGWTDVEPASFRLMPGRDQQVTLRFRPPLDSSTPAGSFPLGVMVTPEEAEHQSPAVAESDLAIGAFHALQAEMVPPRVRGRWRGRHIVKLTNKGTDDVRVKLAAPAEDEALSYALAPTTVAVPSRSTAEAFLRVRPKSPLVLGKPVDHQFEVTYRPRSDSRSPAPTAGLGAASGAGVPDGGETEATLAGTFTQKPIISKLLLVAFALLVLAVVLLLVFRPWEKPAPRRPPEPLANIQMISSTPDEVVVAWDNASNINGVGIREVDCSTADDVLPTAVGEVTVVESSGSGRQSHTVGDLAPGEGHCFQARAVAGDEASIWAPSPAARVSLGGTVVAPTDVEAAHTEACTIEVDWTPVVPESGDLVYQVLVGGDAVGDLVPGGGQMFGDQPPGEELEVTVESVVPATDSGDELRSDPSEPATVTMPEGCDEEGGEDGGGDGGAGGGAGEGDGDGGDAGGGDGGAGGAAGGGGGANRPGDPPRLTGRFWLLFTQPVEADPELRRVWETQWPLLGADAGVWVRGEDEPQPMLGRVGVDVLLPEDLGAGLPGQPVIDLGDEILFVDLYGDDEAQARTDCARINRLWASFENMRTNFQPCRLVHPNGDVEDIAPAR